MKLKEIESVTLKEDNKKLVKPVMQKKADDHDQVLFSSQKVNVNLC